jgi:AbrB family looped-hinge helix DNA binding protein
MTVIVKSKTPIVVPPSVRRQAGLKSGDKLEFRVSGRTITILPNVPNSDGEYTSAQRKAIDRGIAQSEREYAEGKSYGPFGTAGEAIVSMDVNLRRRARAKKLKSTVRCGLILPTACSTHWEDAPLAVRKAFRKQLRFLAENLQHPSLRAKKYDEARDIWQARVNDDWRLRSSAANLHIAEPPVLAGLAVLKL